MNTCMRQSNSKCYTQVTFISFIIIHVAAVLYRYHICRLCTSARHLSLGISMVRATRLRSEGSGLDPNLGLRNRFSDPSALRSHLVHNSRLLIYLLNTTTRMLFEMLFVMLIGAIVFPFALGIQCLHENEKTAKCSGSCIQLT